PLVTPTNASVVTVSGTAEDGATVSIFRDGVLVESVGVSGGRFALDVAVPEGTETNWSVTARAVDALGNASEVSSPLGVAVDRVAPATPGFTSPAAGRPVFAGEVVFQGTAEPGAEVSVRVGDEVHTATADEDG